MEQLTLNWEGPFKINQRMPSHLIGAIGLYLCECDSKIVYVGKAETQGAFKRLRDHFRGQMDSTGKCVLSKARDKRKSNINNWVGWIEEGEPSELIDDAEQLMIYRLQPPCNRNHLVKYEGSPLLIKNKGNHPKDLPEEIRFP